MDAVSRVRSQEGGLSDDWLGRLFAMYHGFVSNLEKELSGATITDATELIDPVKAEKGPEGVNRW